MNTMDEVLRDAQGGAGSGFQTVEAEQEIDLLELLFRLLEKIKWIVLATVVAALLTAVYSIYLITPVYESIAKLYVTNSKDSALNLADLQIGTYLTNDYQEVFKTWEVKESVIQNLNLPYTYEELDEMATISNPSNTRILFITVRSKSAEEAAQIANTTAEVLRVRIEETMDASRPTIVSSGPISDIPINRNITRNTLLGGLAGAFISIVIISLLFIMDDKVKSADDILRYSGMTTLAVVPLLSREGGQPSGHRPTQRPKKRTVREKGKGKEASA
jgi:capsular polysaccharide biosynthesis protein